MKIKAPPGHEYAIGRDLFGNTFVAFKTRRHTDYIYGMFKGRELVGGHLDSIISWHKEKERVVFSGHPTKGNIILVMGIPITEITGQEADTAVAELRAAGISEEA
jgi:hypothetical protein